MALDASNVNVAVTGALSLGGDTAVAPTDAVAVLGTGWVDLGYISEDGVTETRDRSSEQVRAWQNKDLLRVVVTESGMTYSCVLVETKAEVVGLYYGTTVAADGSVIINPGETGGRHKFVLDLVDGDDKIRVYIPAGEVTEVGDQVYDGTQAIGYEVTITAYPDASLAGPGGRPGSAVKFYSALDTTP
mgnify:CR=1 FL=1